MSVAPSLNIGRPDGLIRVQHSNKCGLCPFTEWREGAGYFWAPYRAGPWKGPHRSREAALTAALDEPKRKRR